MLCPFNPKFQHELVRSHPKLLLKCTGEMENAQARLAGQVGEREGAGTTIVEEFTDQAATLRAESTFRPFSRRDSVVPMEVNGQVMAQRLAVQSAMGRTGMQFGYHQADQRKDAWVCASHLGMEAKGRPLDRKEIEREVQNRVCDGIRPSERRDRLAAGTEAHSSGGERDEPVWFVVAPPDTNGGSQVHNQSVGATG